MKFLSYTLVRFGIMIVVFFLCLWLGTGMVLGGLFAVLIAFAVSYLAFPRLHEAASRDFGRFVQRVRPRRARATRQEQDASVEDAYVDQRLREEGREV